MNQTGLLDSESPILVCGGATDDELAWLRKFSYWTNGVFQLILGCMGFIANCVVIPVLCTKKMNSIFNHLLICLAVFDNIYVLCSILECIRTYFISTPGQMKLCIYFLYQLQNIAFICSIYQTVLLAVQRYLAVSRPLEYYVDNTIAAAGGPNWGVAMKYTIPVVTFSVLFNLPKFFEFTLQEISIINPNATNGTNAVQSVDLKPIPTKLRLDDNYVYYYVNWARFVISGLLPLICLTFLNLAIYRGIKARRKAIHSMVGQNRGISSNDNSSTTLGLCSTVEELVLFVIVVIFFICTIPRIVLNAYEMASLESIRDNLNNDCFRFPLWVLLTTQATYILTCFSCCVNFVVYCVLYAAFRKELKAQVELANLKLAKIWNLFKESECKCRRTNPAAHLPSNSPKGKSPSGRGNRDLEMKAVVVSV